MVKGGRVTLVYYDIAESANFVVAIRGSTSEVEPAMQAGLAAIAKVHGAELISHYIVPNPPPNIVAVLPIEYSEKVERFRT
jgi:microcompartment protein CcmL/EutN